MAQKAHFKELSNLSDQKEKDLVTKLYIITYAYFFFFQFFLNIIYV